jgi:hypothetical protein
LPAWKTQLFGLAAVLQSAIAASSSGSPR